MTLESLQDLTSSICDPLVCPVSLFSIYFWTVAGIRIEIFRQLNGQRKLLDALQSVIPVVPRKAVPGVSKGKVYIYIYNIYVNQKKNVNIGIDCDLLNTLQSISTSHSTSHVTLFWWWQKHRNTKYYSVRTSKYDSGLITKFYSGTFPYYKVQQRTKKYCKGLNCSPFDSRSTWNVQYIAWSNLCDAKHNGTTTFMFDSRNTWKLIYIGWSNL